MTATATFVINDLIPATAPPGVPGVPSSAGVPSLAGASGAEGADTGKLTFAAILAAAKVGIAGDAGELQLVSSVPVVETGDQTMDGLDATLIPASPVALFNAISAGPFGLLSGDALDSLPGSAPDVPPGEAPMPPAVAANLGAAPQILPLEQGFILPVDPPQPSTAGKSPDIGAPAPHAVDIVPADGAIKTAYLAITNSSSTVANDTVAQAKIVLQSLPVTPTPQAQSEMPVAPAASAVQSVAVGLTGNVGQPAVQTTKDPASPPNVNIDALAIARARISDVPASEVARVAVSIPRPALAGEVAIAVAAATPSAEEHSTITPNMAAGINAGANAIAASAHSGEPSTAEAVLAALVAGAQTGGKSQEAPIVAKESLSTSSGVGDVRADGSLPLAHQTIVNSPSPSQAALQAGRDTSVPQPPIEQVEMQLRAAVKKGIDRITIQLKPATLGAIDVKLDIRHDGRVIAVITADRSDTLNLFQRDARGLEHALQNAGLNTDSGSLSFNLRGEGSYADAQAYAQESNEFDPRLSGDEPEGNNFDSPPPPIAPDRALDIRV